MSDNPRPLDETLYSLDEDEIELLKSKTGITDDDELRKHVMKVQADIYAVRLFGTNQESYETVLGTFISLHSSICICEVRVL